MELDVIFPTRQIGTDPDAIRAYAQAAEAAGYGDLHAYDHVLGADRDYHGFEGPYDHEDAFHEPFVLFGHLAAVTDSLNFATGILVLPQRGTELVAKQAAAADVLSEGRIRLGVGVGWNRVEYEALGKDFTTRGRRIDEQIDVLRALWTEELVTYEGEYHAIDRAGINPLPVQQPIPIWIGGGAEVVLRRTGRLGDGWIAPGAYRRAEAPLSELDGKLETIREAATAAGRDPEALDVIGRMTLPEGGPEAWTERAREWEAVGATRLAIDTMDTEFETADEHVAAIERFMDAAEDAGLT
jgi:probable F420-dependent oxidoreductase